jgi:carboxymethylenebutenolidase
MTGTMIEIEAADGSGQFQAYASGPEDAASGVVVIQEIFGISESMKAVADHWGAQGRRAIVPDLFWRIEPGVALDSTQESERERAMEYYGKFDNAKGVEDCVAAVGHLRRTCARVGAVGFCLGGRLAYHTAVHSDAEACVGYYGVGIESVLDEAQDGIGSLLLHFGETDELCGPEARAAIYGALEGRDGVELHLYGGAGHAFARSNSVNFNPQAADLANQRTADFFARYLD